MKVLRNLVLALLLLCALALAALWVCPADIAYRAFSDRLGPVVLADLSGTAWHGHATSTRVFERELGSLDWDLEKLPLLHHQIDVHVNLVGPAASAQAQLRRNADHTLDISAATVMLPATVLEPAIGVPDLHLGGQLEIHLANAKMRGAWMQSANGDAWWRDASVSGSAQAKLSDLHATFVTMPDGAITGELKDTGGPLQADGMFNASLGGYDAQLRLSARDGDPHVQEALLHVGEAQPDGSVLLKIRGHLLKVL